jgi:ribose transport system permease protein
MTDSTLTAASDVVPTTPLEIEQQKSRAQWFVQDVLIRFGMVWVLVILMIVANFIYPGFFEWGNLRNMLSQNAPVGLVAIGMTFVIIGGGFDLSVGAIVAVGAVLFAGFSGDMPIGLAFVATVGAGVVAGALNGLIITRFNVNPFVATLATASLFSGGALLYSKSLPVLSDHPNFMKFGSDSWLGLPIVVWVLGVAFATGAVLLGRTVYGRSVYAVGGNVEAARLAGMRVNVIRGSTYLLTGACAAIAGMMIASKTGVGQGDVGVNITLDSIAIVIIGGTSLMGGEGALWRTIVGLLILATINNVFDSLALQQSAQSVVKGAIVLGAVGIDAYARSRRS